MKLYLLLKQTGHEANKPVFDQLTKSYFFCKKHDKSLDHFKLNLQDNINCNYSIFINIMYINNSLILYIIDETTSYKTAK